MEFFNPMLAEKGFNYLEKHPWVYKKRNVNYRLNLQNTILYLIEFGKLDYNQKSKLAKNYLMNGRSNDQNHDLFDESRIVIFHSYTFYYYYFI